MTKVLLTKQAMKKVAKNMHDNDEIPTNLSVSDKLGFTMKTLRALENNRTSAAFKFTKQFPES